MSETIAAQFIGGIPGNPATVWASAHAMLEAAQAISIGFDYLQAAGSATPTWTGEASQSFASKVEAGGEKLDTLISALKCGARITRESSRTRRLKRQTFARTWIP